MVLLLSKNIKQGTAGCSSLITKNNRIDHKNQPAHAKEISISINGKKPNIPSDKRITKVIRAVSFWTLAPNIE